jgi:hypothetical protein
MKTSLIKQLSITIAACLVGAMTAISAPYEKGQRVDAFQAKDQHENAFTLKPAETDYLLVSHDMDTGKKANGVLTGMGKNYLEGRKAVYMANIHGMPGIGRMFALPKMKKYEHRIILGDDEALIARFPSQPGKVTVIALKGGKVESIKYWTPGTEKLEDYLK